MILKRTRLAPTPSGLLHAGNAYSFLLTQALAKKYGASILLRIDDMDALRMREEYVQDIFDSLRWLEIDWQEGPKNTKEQLENFTQRKRVPLYKAMLERLKEGGHLFACACSRKKLEQKESGCDCESKKLDFNAREVSWKLRSMKSEKIRMRTLEGDQEMELPVAMKNAVMRKKDGDPSYQICSLSDDVHYGVELVLRGEDLLPSTLVQLHLASLLGEEGFLNTVFHHHFLLKDEDGNKLSKSNGSTSLRSLREKGMRVEELKQLIGFRI